MKTMRKYPSNYHLAGHIAGLLERKLYAHYEDDDRLHCLDVFSTETTVAIHDFRNGVEKENRKDLRIYIIRKAGETHASIRCKSLNQKQDNFEHKFPAYSIKMRVKGSAYRTHEDAFEINPRQIPTLIKALTEWVKEELK